MAISGPFLQLLGNHPTAGIRIQTADAGVFVVQPLFEVVDEIADDRTRTASG